MFTALFMLIFLGASLASIAGILALRAWLRFRRVRVRFQTEISDEVIRLSARTDELEKGVNSLSERASTLPMRISELQRNIAVLQTLTASLAASLRQAQRVLTFSGMKTISSSALGDALRPLFDRIERS
jgi:predicted RNase H-like nuclease (RuvC/YqgF family)